MKRVIIFFKGKQKDNRGLSLIELIIAIAILAIVITPVFNAFITSARINLNARKTLAATDVAQTIQEGFADKHYEAGVVQAIKTLNSQDIVNSTQGLVLSSLNDDYYNMKDNYYNMADGEAVSPILLGAASTGMNQIYMDGALYTAIDLISGNAIPNGGSGGPADTLSANRLVANAAAAKLASDGDQKVLMGWLSSFGGPNRAGALAALVYTDVELEGFVFDAVVTFLPMAVNTGDIYYPYCVTIAVYDARMDVDNDGTYDRFHEDALMNVMLGGIAN